MDERLTTSWRFVLLQRKGLKVDLSLSTVYFEFKNFENRLLLDLQVENRYLVYSLVEHALHHFVFESPPLA